MARTKKKQQKKAPKKKSGGVRKSSGTTKVTRKRKRRIIESDSEYDENIDNENGPSDASRSAKGRKKAKGNKEKKSVEAEDLGEDSHQVLLDLNLEKSGGKESFQKEMKRLGDAADAKLKSNSNASQTGVSYITQYRRQCISEFLLLRKQWKEAEEFSSDKDVFRDKMHAMKVPGTWQYKYKFRNEDGNNILQCWSDKFNKRVDKSITTAARRKSMKEEDWVDVICIDDPEYFEKVNDVHWSDDPKRHLKGVLFYNACLDVMSSNINNEICYQLTKHCKVCQVVVKRYLKKKKKEVVDEEMKSYVHINLLQFDSTLLSDRRDVVSHLVTVIYNNGFTDFIPMKGNSDESIAGYLYHSFSRNTLPSELKVVYSNGSSLERKIGNEDIKQPLCEVEKSIITYLNHGLNENRKIKSKEGSNDCCDEMKYSVTFLLGCLHAHLHNLTNENIVMFIAMMNESINRKLKFHEFKKQSLEVDPNLYAKEFISVRFPKSNLCSEGSGQLEKVNDSETDVNALDSNSTLTPVMKNSNLSSVVDKDNHSLHKDSSASVVRNLKFPNDVDNDDEEIGDVCQKEIQTSAQVMANHFCDQIVNNQTFDTESTDQSAPSLIMPPTLSQLPTLPGFLVPITNPGNQCYANAVLQLLQLMPDLWSDMATSFAEEGLMFEDVCEQRPISFALLMFGSKIKNEYQKKVKELKEPSSVNNNTWRLFQSNENILSDADQEDASEFLILMLEGIFDENKGSKTIMKSFDDQIFFTSKMRYQCQDCKSLKETTAQVSNLINFVN